MSAGCEEAILTGVRAADGWSSHRRDTVSGYPVTRPCSRTDVSARITCSLGVWWMPGLPGEGPRFFPAPRGYQRIRRRVRKFPES